MAGLPRLNSVIRTLEQGQVPIAAFVSPPTVEGAIAMSTAGYDGVIFESEHHPYDIKDLRDCLQYMLNRKQIAAQGTIASGVTPLIRIPPNGAERNQAYAKQVLDIGAYGVVWPHISTVEEAYNAVSACRYPRPSTAAFYEPQGQRGDSPAAAARYWGLTVQEYYKKADVWPLNPDGEILVIIMCEDVTGMNNLPEILKNVPGIGVVLIGEGDLSQNLGYPRQYEHPVVVEAMAQIRAVCKEHKVPCGHPHIEVSNAQQHIDEGYGFLMTAPVRSYPGLDACRKILGR
jgi:4-hydroxy-2-oxoheptanedioate aldolase